MTPGRFDLRSLAFSGFLAILPLAPAVRADLIYQLTDDGCSGGCGPQVSFGQVDLHTVTATEVEVTVTLFNGNEFVMTGNHEGLTFNVDDGTATVVPVTTGSTNTVARAAHFFQRTIHHLPDRPQRMIRQNPFLHRTVTEQLTLLLVFSAHTTDDVRNTSYVTSSSTSTSLGSRTTAFYL